MTDRVWTINFPEAEMEALRKACGLRERGVIELLAMYGDLPPEFGLPPKPEPTPEPAPAPEPRSTENASAPPSEPEVDEGASEDDSEG